MAARALESSTADACEPFLASSTAHITAVKGPRFDIQLREQWLTTLSSRTSARGVIDDVTVSRHGPIAVATVLMTLTDADGAATEHLFTDLWVCERDEWRVLQRYASQPLAA